MKNVLIAVATIAVAATAPSTSSLTARQPSAERFQYLQLSPFADYIQSGPQAVTGSEGFRACIAGPSEWVCRDFARPSRQPRRGVVAPPLGHTDPALRNGLATLGSEGWELVSAVDNAPGEGLIYVFRRPL